MGQQIINIGSSPNKGDGDAIRTAFDKVNDNFTELYLDVVDLKIAVGTTDGGITITANAVKADVIGQDSSVIIDSANNTIKGDFKGSVVADDSTVLIDGVAGTITAGALTGDLPAIDGSALTGVVKPGDTLIGDLKGSVFGDDSVTLIDGVASTFNLDGTIKGHVIPAENEKYNLGSASHRWKTLFLSATTLKLGELSLRYTNGKLGVSLDKGPGGEYHGSGWWSTAWYPAGSFSQNIAGIDNTQAVLLHQHQTDGDTENWEDSLTNAKTGEIFILSDPLTDEETVTLTSDAVKVFIAGTSYYYYYNVAEDPPSGNVTNIYTLFYPVLVNDKLEGPLDGNITNSNGDTLIDATSGTLNADALSGNVDSTLIAGALFNVAADDSTQRAIAQGNTVQIIGAGGITTTSDADGVITITSGGLELTAGSTQSVDIVAADSTLLVDSVNGTLNATTLTGALPAIDGSALTGVTTAFSNITSTPTTLAGYGITDAVADFADLGTTPTTLAGYGITDAVASSGGNISLADDEKLIFGTDDDLEIFHNSSNGNTIIENNTGNLVIKGSNLFLQSASSEYFFRGAANGAVTLYYDNVAKFNTSASGIKIEAGVEEKFATTNAATGVTALDCATGHVHYLTSPAGDVTANFTNLNLTAEYATNLTVIINQGATPYEVTAVQIGGAAQTINWQGGSAPTGNANGIDSFSFTILNDGGTYVVLGQMVDFT
jgi:hypothetical protein